MREESLDKDASLGAMFAACAGARPDAVHLVSVTRDGQVTVHRYRESLAAARRAAAVLTERGLEPGMTVAVLDTPTPALVEIMFGVWLAGGVLVPLDPDWQPDALARALAKAQVRFGFASSDHAEALKAAATELPGFQIIDPAAAGSTNKVALDAEVDASQRALILFTSGTTGEPKAAVLTHRALGWNARALVDTIGVDAEDNLLSVVPLHHIFGLVCNAITPAISGARVTFPASLKGPDVVGAMRKADVTVVPAVPQLVLAFDRLLQTRLETKGRLVRLGFRALGSTTRLLRRFGVNMGPILFRPLHNAIGRQLRFLGSAGAALDPEAARRLWSVGLTVVEGYGLTEAGPTICFDEMNRPTYGSVGRPLKGVDVRIHDPDEAGSGEIVVRSPSLFEGYLDDAKATAEMLRDGWLHTGDLGRLDAAGRLYITGRRREVIVLGSGKNVYPHEIEPRLEESAFIREACVLGLPEVGRPGTDKLHAVLVPDWDALRRVGESRVEVSLGFEVTRIGDRLPSHHRVVGFTVWKEPLSRTPLGKLRRFKIYEQLISEQRGVPKHSEAPPESTRAKPHWRALETALRQVSGHTEPIGLTAGLELDLGLDSLARIEVVAALEEELGRSLPEGFGAEALTVGDVMDELDRSIAAEDVGGFREMSERSPDDELLIWPRRLLRPVGCILIAVLWWPLHLVARLGWGFKVSGREQLPEGAYLLCANHSSYLDGVVVTMALPLRSALRAWTLGDHELFDHPMMRVVGWLANVIRLDALAGLRATLAAGGAVLRRERLLVLYPEGARAPAGERLPFRRGAAILARTADVPIVPAYLSGVDRVLARGSWLPRMGHRMAVRFGEPIDPHTADDASDPAQALTELLRERIAALAPDESGKQA